MRCQQQSERQMVISAQDEDADRREWGSSIRITVDDSIYTHFLKSERPLYSPRRSSYSSWQLRTENLRTFKSRRNAYRGPTSKTAGPAATVSSVTVVLQPVSTT